MKKLILFLFALTLCTAPCHAQFGALNKIYKAAKAAKKAKKANSDEFGNQKIKDLLKGATIDTTSTEYKKAVAKVQQEMYESNPQLKKMMELQGDSVALKKYMEELYGGMSQEDIARKALEGSDIDFDSKEAQDAYAQAQNMSGITEDPVFKKIMAEGRQATMKEAIYLNEKYGTDFEYEGMEAYNDSIGVFAHLDGKMKPMSITKFESISEERPGLDLGQNEIKQYVQNYIAILKKPLADREVVDSVQNYLIYPKRHAEEQFKGSAKFTIYSNLETDNSEKTVNEVLLRQTVLFAEPIDPSKIFVFKVHKGIGCRYMEYMYSKISYKQSELNDYISKRLINEGYIDANITKRMSDDQLYKAMDKMEFEFKVEILGEKLQNDEKFMFTNTIPAAQNVRIKSQTHKVGGHVTALDLTIEAEPGEYAFLIRDPEVDQYFKDNNFDISVLLQGAFFFTIK